jgi:hypothetical protein
MLAQKYNNQIKNWYNPNIFKKHFENLGIIHNIKYYFFHTIVFLKSDTVF